MKYLFLFAMAGSGLLLGVTLTALVKAEESMLAGGGKRNWKVLARLLLNTLLSLVLGLTLIMLTALDDSVTIDDISYFGIAAMVLMAVPVLRYRWQQMKKKKDSKN